MFLVVLSLGRFSDLILAESNSWLADRVRMETFASYQGQRENNERTTIVADREASAYSNPWSSQWPSTNTQVELIDTCTDSSNIRDKRDSLIRKESVERTRLNA